MKNLSYQEQKMLKRYKFSCISRGKLLIKLQKVASYHKEDLEKFQVLNHEIMTIIESFLDEPIKSPEEPKT